MVWKKNTRKRSIKSTMTTKKPLGISIIAVLGIVIGSILVFEGIAIFFVGDLILGPYLNLKEALGIFFLVFGLSLIVLHWFLWKMNKIAFIIRMALGSLALVVGLASLTVFGIGIAIMHGIMLYYLYIKKDMFIKKV